MESPIAAGLAHVARHGSIVYSKYTRVLEAVPGCEGGLAGMPVVEFIVDGSPLSHQTKNRKELQAWKARVRAEATKVWTGAPMQGMLQCTIINFFAGPEALLDDDNMVKPIRDALNGLVYEDDRQIRHSYHGQLSNAGRFQIRGAAKIVVDALREGKTFVFVRIEDAPTEPQLPR